MCSSRPLFGTKNKTPHGAKVHDLSAGSTPFGYVPPLSLAEGGSFTIDRPSLEVKAHSPRRRIPTVRLQREDFLQGLVVERCLGRRGDAARDEQGVVIEQHGPAPDYGKRSVTAQPGYDGMAEIQGERGFGNASFHQRRPGARGGATGRLVHPLFEMAFSTGAEVAVAGDDHGGSIVTIVACQRNFAVEAREDFPEQTKESACLGRFTGGSRESFPYLRGRGLVDMAFRIEALEPPHNFIIPVDVAQIDHAEPVVER